MQTLELRPKHQLQLLYPKVGASKDTLKLAPFRMVKLTGIHQATISAIENDRVRGVERAKVLTRALKCHPGVLVFPGWEPSESGSIGNPYLLP